MEILKKRPGDNIFVVQGEKKILFDLSKWEESFGREGRAELLYRRPGESTYYPVALEREGSTAVWNMTAADTAKEGTGRAELRYYMGDRLVYSLTSDITVEHPMDEAGEVAAPPGQSWLDQVLEAARRAEDAAERAVEDVVKDGRIAQAVEDYLAEHPVQGEGGVYVGSGDMPEGYNVQIDPTGFADVAATREWVNNHVQEAIQNGADPVGTAERNVAEHNTSTDSHNDIRLIIDGLSNRLNALVNSTDNNLEKIAELVEYINANKDLIDSITTSKVSVTDIINNLTTNVADKPLSAAQGVALKALIDAITIPTKLSQLTNDTGYLTQHQSLSGYAKTSDIKEWALGQIQAAIDATWGAIY